jgi:hypothetical protein
MTVLMLDSGADRPMVSAQRALASDARLAFTILNELRYPVLRRVFGVSRDQANLLTFVLALMAAHESYDIARKILRIRWPLRGADNAIAGVLLREAGFAIAGPKAREVQLGGALIALAAVGSLTLPGLRRALHNLHVLEQRVGEQRRRIYGAAQRGTREAFTPASRA